MPKLAIRQQIMVLAILPFLLVAGGTGLFLLNSYLTEVHHLDEAMAQRSARLLSRHLAASLRQNTDAVDAILASSLDREMLGVGLLGLNGEWLATRGQPQKPDISRASGNKEPVWQTSELTATWPIYRYDHTALSPQSGKEPPQLGWAVVTTSHNHFLQARYLVIAISLLWLLLMLLLVVYLGGRLTRDFDTSIKQMRDLISNLDQHDWSTRLPHSKNRDWQFLFGAINELAHRTQQHLRQLQNDIEHSHEDLQKTLESLEISNMELALAREEALTASQSKSEFLANTSHEVRTPLTGILGFCHVLLESESNPRRREYIETIKISAEHLLRVLDDILDLSKIEAGKFSLQLQPFALLPVIEESAALFAQQAADKGIELIVDTAEPLPVSVSGDSARLKQLATNLISNAVKFTDRGQVLITLSAENHSDDSSDICLSISDTGIGIRQQEQAKLFQAFQQLDGTDTRKHGGTGLGLAMVKRLVDLMRGSIHVSSEPGRGTRFDVRLPLSSEAPVNPTEPKNQIVHFWEENPDARRALRRRLQANGFQSQAHDTLSQLLAAASPEVHLVAGFSSQRSFFDVEPQLTAYSELIVLLPSLAGVLAREDFIFLQKPLAEHKLLQALAGEDKRAGTQSLKASSVLVVDDNRSNRLLLSALLEELQAKGTLCASGREALALCEQQAYPLIILDLQMPDMNGEDTARAIRETPLNRHSRLVALTAHLPDDGRQASPLFDQFMLKPMTLVALRQLLDISSRPDGAVNTALSLKRANNNPQLAQVLTERFLLSLEETREEWRAAIADRNTGAIESLAHQLVGACRYVGAPSLERALEGLQKQLEGAEFEEVRTLTENCLNCMDDLLCWRTRNAVDEALVPDSG